MSAIGRSEPPPFRWAGGGQREWDAARARFWATVKATPATPVGPACWIGFRWEPAPWAGDAHWQWDDLTYWSQWDATLSYQTRCMLCGSRVASPRGRGHVCAGRPPAPGHFEQLGLGL